VPEKHFLEFFAGETLQKARRRIPPEFLWRADRTHLLNGERINEQRGKGNGEGMEGREEMRDEGMRK
jgi:hypothetical protein